MTVNDSKSYVRYSNKVVSEYVALFVGNLLILIICSV